jgi:peptidoglycan hydrolase-like protein with peptidoglycan-binding domain
MAGDSTLAQVAQGTTELSVGSKGEPVRKMQEALELAGHKLPRSGADGDFGQETKRALVAFQKAQKIVPANGQLDAKTIAALDTAAASKLKSPEYDKLYADKVLNTTIAIGYDEGGAQKQQIKQTVDGLFSRGYKQFDVKTATDAELKKVGIDPTKVDRDATYFVKSYQYKGKDVQSVVKLITPDTPNAKQKFAEAMNSDEVVMYSGHGRVGSGPDFDDKHSAAGNYVIGKPTVKNYAALGDNDLKKAKLTNDYQLMFFDGCNTKHYVDDLRAIPKNKDSKNLDIVGANTELSWSTSSADVLAMLDGVEGAKSMNEIQADLEKLNKEGPHDKKKHFMTDGFQDN